MCLRACARVFSLRSAFSCARTCFCASIFLRARRRWVTQVSVGALCQGGRGRRLPPHPYSHRPPSCCPRGRPRGEATNIYSPSVPPQTASFLSGPGRLPPPPHHSPSVSGPPVPRGLGGQAPRPALGHGAEGGRYHVQGRGVHGRRPPTGLGAGASYPV